MTSLHPGTLSDQERDVLERDGFVVLKNAVPRDVRDQAKATINADPTRIVHGDNPAINRLYNDSALRDIMLGAMGPHTAPINAQVAVIDKLCDHWSEWDFATGS